MTNRQKKCRKRIIAFGTFINEYFLFYSGHIDTRSRIDADLISDIDKERNLYSRAGFERCGLIACFGSIALNTRLGFRNGKLYEVRRLDAERHALVSLDRYHHFGNDILKRVTALVDIYIDLLESFGLHEMTKIIVSIKELIIMGFDLGIEKFLGGVERFLEYLTRHDILILCSDESRAFARFYMLEINYAEYFTVFLERSAFSEIACYHKILLGFIR